MPRPTRLIAFKAPFVKGADCVAVPILTHVGEWGELLVSSGTLRNLGIAIAQHFSGDESGASVPSHAAPSLRQPIFKPTGRRVL